METLTQEKNKTKQNRRRDVEGERKSSAQKTILHSEEQEGGFLVAFRQGKTQQLRQEIALGLLSRVFGESSSSDFLKIKFLGGMSTEASGTVV